MTQNERLQRAWLALVGWRVGMVVRCSDNITDVVMCLDPDDEKMPAELADDGWLWSEEWLPALDSPANWGHWFEWVVHSVDPLDVFVQASDAGWTAAAGGFVGEPARFPDALLTTWMLYCEEHGTDLEQPPAVLDWWKHEREATCA